MLLARFVLWTFFFGIIFQGFALVFGQDYPSKPIRIVTVPAGGGSDFTSRLIAQRISGPMGQSVVVDNRASEVMAEFVSRASPDGYTLLLAGSIVWIGPLLRTMRYDPERDLSPISMVDRAPSVLLVHPSLPVKSVKELIDLAKARPGELNYASSGAGGASHLAAELFKAITQTNIVRIAYKGGAQALNDLVSGQVHLTFTNSNSLSTHVNSGRLRALAVTSAEPSMLYPGLPTVAATVAGYEMAGITGIFAPAKTPASVIRRLNEEIVRVLNQADVKEKFLSAGSEIASSSPEQLATAMKSDIARMGKVIKEARIREE